MAGDEIFDVVDERDRVIGQAPRREVHARGLRHRAVHILIFNARGEVFLQKRSARKDLSPLTWDSSSSGHLDAGEDYDQAAIRELREELGVAALALERWFRVEACPETGNEFVWVYRLRHEGPFQLNPDEIGDGHWFSSAALEDRLRRRPADFAPAFRFIWTRLPL